MDIVVFSQFSNLFLKRKKWNNEQEKILKQHIEDNWNFYYSKNTHQDLVIVCCTNLAIVIERRNGTGLNKLIQGSTKKTLLCTVINYRLWFFGQLQSQLNRKISWNHALITVIFNFISFSIVVFYGNCCRDEYCNILAGWPIFMEGILWKLSKEWNVIRRKSFRNLNYIFIR